MYKRLLVPTDGTERSIHAIKGATGFARQIGAEIVLMTVIEPYSYTNLSEYRPETLEEYETRMADEADERLGIAHRVCVDAGLSNPLTLAVKSFSPAEAIISTAKSHHCDLIWMASHGRQGISAMLLGSETQKVLTQSTIPVMVYR